MSSGTGPRWPRASRAPSTRARSIPVRCAAGAAAHGCGRPGRQVGGRGITCGGTGRDIPARYRRPARPPDPAHAVARRVWRLATLSQPMTSPEELQAQADAFALVPHHRPGQRRRHQGYQRAGESAGRPPRRHRPQRARHRRLGRQVLVPGRAVRAPAGSWRSTTTPGASTSSPAATTGPSASTSGTLPDQSRDETDFWRPDLPGRRGFELGRGGAGVEGRAAGGRLPDRRPRRARSVRRRPLPRRAVPHEGTADLPRTSATRHQGGRRH